MIEKGASYLRYDDTATSSKRIIEACLGKYDPTRKTDPTPPYFVSELQKGVVPDDIILPLLLEANGRARVPVLDAKDWACVEEEMHRFWQELEQEDEYYPEVGGATKADNQSLEYEPSEAKVEDRDQAYSGERPSHRQPPFDCIISTLADGKALENLIGFLLQTLQLESCRGALLESALSACFV